MENKVKEKLIEIAESGTVEKFMLVTLDKDFKAQVHFENTNLMENCFMTKVADDVLSRILNGEKASK